MDTVTINRAPVLTLWAAVVAARLGFDREEALTLGKSVAGLTAQSKGHRLGIFTPSPEAVRRQRAENARAAGVFHVALPGRAVPVLHTDEGLRATGKDQKPVSPDSVEKYLAAKFGQALPMVRHAMETLAESREPEALAEEAQEAGPFFLRSPSLRQQSSPGKAARPHASAYCAATGSRGLAPVSGGNRNR
jgi:hypothetical protein